MHPGSVGAGVEGWKSWIILQGINNRPGNGVIQKNGAIAGAVGINGNRTIIGAGTDGGNYRNR